MNTSSIISELMSCKPHRNLLSGLRVRNSKTNNIVDAKVVLWILLFNVDLKYDLLNYTRRSLFLLWHSTPLLIFVTFRYLVQDEIECGRRCVRHEECMSYNVQHKVNNTNRRTCELNSQTKESKPQAFKAKDGFQYYGSLHERNVWRHD